jgi:hypothetical protein
MNLEIILWNHKSHEIGVGNEVCPGKKKGCYEHHNSGPEVKNHLTPTAKRILFVLVVAFIAAYKFFQ